MFREKNIGCYFWHMEPTGSKLKISLTYFLRNCQRNSEPGYKACDYKATRRPQTYKSRVSSGKPMLPFKNCNALSALEEKRPIRKLPAPIGHRVFTRSAWEGPSPATDWWWLIISLLSGNFHGSYSILVILWLNVTLFSCDFSISMCEKQGGYFHSQFTSEETRPREVTTMAVVSAIPHPNTLLVQL